MLALLVTSLGIDFITVVLCEKYQHVGTHFRQPYIGMHLSIPAQEPHILLPLKAAHSNRSSASNECSLVHWSRYEVTSRKVRPYKFIRCRKCLHFIAHGLSRTLVGETKGCWLQVALMHFAGPGDNPQHNTAQDHKWFKDLRARTECVVAHEQ
jgi:hypothetical protein